MRDTILSNSAIANSLKNRASAIDSAQIEECIYQLSKTGQKIDESKVREIYAGIFGNGLLNSAFAEFCKSLNDFVVLDTPKNHTEKKHCHVCYVNNIYSGRALEKLCRGLEPRLETGNDFKSICEAVYYEMCDFCAIPLCSTADGYFTSFFKLLRSYDLKIIKVCTVSDIASDNDIRYALLGRNVEHCESSSNLALSLSPVKFLPSELFSAFAVLDGNIDFVYTTPTEYNIDLSEFTLGVSTKPETLPALIRFVKAALPSSNIIGIY